MKIWAEFLGGWFDGSQHMIRGAFVDIPVIYKITFQEMAVQPENGLYLQVTTERPANVVKRLWSDGRWMVQEYVTVHFWFRSLIKTQHAGHNSISMVRLGADTLFSILSSNILVEPLARRGMQQFQVTPPKLIGGGSPPMRQISLKCCYVYPLEETIMNTFPSVESDLPGGVVYIGKDRTIRVTNAGFEKKGPDGNWYVIDVALLTGETGAIVPSVSVEIASDN